MSNDLPVDKHSSTVKLKLKTNLYSAIKSEDSEALIPHISRFFVNV